MFFLIKYLIRLIQRRRQAGESSAGHEPAEREEPRSLAEETPPSPPRRRTRPAGPSAAAHGPLALLGHQLLYDLRVSLRNPRARFTTFIFPILLLVIFNGAFGSGHTSISGQRITLARFYVPGIITLSIVVGSYGMLVQSITTLRENGILKRRRATPVPAALLIAGQALTTVVIAAITTTVLLVIAKVFYGIGFGLGPIAAIACTATLATLACACIGFLVSSLIGSPDAALPVVQATMLPLWFLSGVFIPMSNLSKGLRTIGEIFPVEHLANGLHLASVSSTFSASIHAGDLLALAAWALGAGALAAWRFSWLPSRAGA